MDVDGGLDDGLRLHFRDLRIHDGQTAAAQPHHGVDLVHGADGRLELVQLDTHILGERLLLRLAGRKKFVQRRVKQTYRDGTTTHDAENALKVAALHGQQLGKRRTAVARVGGEYHLAHGADAVWVEEHMLRADKTDTLRAEVQRSLGVGGRVGVGANAQCAYLVRPAHDGGELPRDLDGDGGYFAEVDMAGRAVDGEPVALAHKRFIGGEVFLVLKNAKLTAAGHAAGADLTGDDGGMAGASAVRREYALGGVHALHVLGARLVADEQHGAVRGAFYRVGGGEADLSTGRAGRGGKPGGNGTGGGQRLAVEAGVEQRVELARLQLHDGLLLGAYALAHEVDGDLHGGLRRALAVTGLEHKELAALDGELHVLHILIVLFKRVAYFHELLVDLGHDAGKLVNALWGAYTGHDVLALRVHEKLAVEPVLAGGGVAGKGHARAGVVAHVAERHAHDVDGRTPAIGDVVDTAVVVGAGIVPASENGLDGLRELLRRVLRERHTHAGEIVFLIEPDDLAQILRRQLGVECHPGVVPRRGEYVLKLVVRQLHDHVGVHLDEAAVAVIRPARVAGGIRQRLGHLVVEAEVEDGVHHTGHRGASAGADGHEQRLLRVAEAQTGLRL